MNTRFNKIYKILENNSLDAIALIPGSNFKYLTHKLSYIIKFDSNTQSSTSFTFSINYYALRRRGPSSPRWLAQWARAPPPPPPPRGRRRRRAPSQARTRPARLLRVRVRGVGQD